MTQQTKTEALEELARLIRRDIMNGTAPLNGVWWFTDDVKLQDRIAHVLLDYSDEEKPTGPTIAGATLSWMHEQIEKAERNANKQIDALTEKCAALVVERDQMHRQMVSLVEDPAHISSPFGMLPINSNGMRRLIDEFVKVRDLYLGIGAPALPEPHALRIDPDMSDPQPGKLLVVRLSEKDARMMRAAPQTVLDCVGFLVETPAVEVKEQGPWVVYDVDEPNWRMRDAWVYAVSGEGFDSKEEAQKIIDDFGRGGKRMRVITLAEARAIVGGA